MPTPPVANVGAQMNAAQAAAARARRRARGPLMGTVGQAVPTGTAGTRTLLGGY
ncbi:MAG TPA: hypothetical protein VKB41_05015 [Steroidobacteraceae bacterium]|nr:hypothetical protein [Steroidobacteraceae bacterium]